MKVGDLINHLKEFPADYSVELSKLFTVNENDEVCELILDSPIAGLSRSDEAKDVRLVLFCDQEKSIFGKIVPCEDKK